MAVLLALVPWARPAHGAVDQEPNPFERNTWLGRGVNMGNALDAPNEGDWGIRLEAEFFRLIAEKGFNSVRIPVRWSNHCLNQPPYTIDESFFERVDWAIDQALENDLAAVVDIHHYEKMWGNLAGEEARFYALWEQLAARYRDRGPQLFFELLNEPKGDVDSTNWSSLAAEAIGIIRQSNPDRTIIVATPDRRLPEETDRNLSGVHGLKHLTLPPGERNLIVTIHYYLPLTFTHQTASWVAGSQAWAGTEWNGTQEERDWTRAHFQIAADWSAKNGFPIFLGEFGAYSGADFDSRVRWTDFVAETAEELGFTWAYWEFGAEFGLYDRGAKQWREGLVGPLFDTPYVPVVGLRSRLPTLAPRPGEMAESLSGRRDPAGRRLTPQRALGGHWIRVIPQITSP